MMFPSNRVRIVVATKPVDFRKGHDGLAALVKNELRKEPFTGTVFVFRAKRADRLKLLYWDGTGLVMAYKRLEETTFTWPAIKDGLMALNHAQFEALFSGLAPLSAMQASPAGQRAESEGPGGASAHCGRVNWAGFCAGAQTSKAIAFGHAEPCQSS
jgi:transposase